MREVERDRFVGATPAELERHLSPESLVEYEGTFVVRDVTDVDGGTVVTAGARGLQVTLRFEPREAGYYYAQEGSAGPFERMETWLTYEREDEGSRVTLRSTVSLGLPLPALTDRVAAWKRGGELDRALASLAADV